MKINNLTSTMCQLLQMIKNLKILIQNLYEEICELFFEARNYVLIFLHNIVKA